MLREKNKIAARPINFERPFQTSALTSSSFIVIYCKMSRPLSIYFDKIFWGGIWIAAHFGLFVWAYMEERNRVDNVGNKSLLGVYLYAARGAARALNFDMGAILLPVSRGLLTSIKQIPYIGRLIPFDKHIKFHMIIGYTMIVFTYVHTIAHYFNIRQLSMALGESTVNSHSVNWQTWAGVTGNMMIFILILMSSSAAEPVKKHCFELFWYVHHLFWLFFLAALTHSFSCILKTDDDKCYGKTTWKWVSPGLTIYIIEILLRWFRSKRATYIRKVIIHPSKTFEIQFLKRSMHVKPGQYVFLNVPEISKLEWHPYTLTSCQEEGYHSVHIRTVGDWTESLARKLGCLDANGNWDLDADIRYDQLPSLKVDGPYGAASEDVFDYPIVMMIGGGIGVTPFASVLKHLWFTLRNHDPNKKMKLRKVYFVWIVRQTASFEWFQKLLSDIERESVHRNLQNLIDIRVYVTAPLSDEQRINIILNDSRGGKDAVTKLRAPTHFGRPNIPALFHRIKSEHFGEERLDVGVFFCGPNKLGNRLRIEAKKATDGQAAFSFNKEIF